MQIPNEPRFSESGVHGPMPVIWYGVNAVDGDAYPWLQAASGSLYGLRDLTNKDVKWYEKRAEEGRDDDWGALGGIGVIQERVSYSDFTDGGAATGTYTMTAGTIPAGALFYKCILKDVDDFVGATTCVLDVGDNLGSPDDDRYQANGAFDLTADAVAIDGGTPQGTLIHTAAVTPILTVVEDDDFTDITAGAFTICLYYFL